MPSWLNLAYLFLSYIDGYESASTHYTAGGRNLFDLPNALKCEMKEKWFQRIIIPSIFIP